MVGVYLIQLSLVSGLDWFGMFVPQLLLNREGS